MYKLIKDGNRFYFVENNQRITEDFGYIFESGAPRGESPYFIATKQPVLKEERPTIAMKRSKWAIYDIRTRKRVTQYYDWITTKGLVQGQSIYFRAELDKHEAIFTLENQVTKWFRKIRDRGVLTGESSYYWAKEKTHYALYDIDTGKKLTEDYKSSVIAGAVIGKGSYIVGSYGDEIFFIVDLKTGKRLTDDFDEPTLIEILKHGDLEKAVKDLTGQ
ncbi:MAG: hypothetical protein GXO22_03125 [Aquificae bacterium]|nr:hypothetical protein [Aquificota bacterium]